LTGLLKIVPEQLSCFCVLCSYHLEILPTVWNTLTPSAHVYVATIVNNETEDVEQEVESDGNDAFRA